MSLRRSGILDQVVAFKVTAYLKNEVDFTPWRTVFRNLAYIELMLDRTATRGLYEVSSTLSQKRSSKNVIAFAF